MTLDQIPKKVIHSCEKAYGYVNHQAAVEVIIAVLLTGLPLVLYLADLNFYTGFRRSISDYAFMCDSYWFGSLLALAGALFIFNGAKHMGGYRIQQQEIAKQQSAKSTPNQHHIPNKSQRFGRGYNIIFGIALFGVIYFDYLKYEVIHFVCAGIFYLGCALSMLLAPRKELKKEGVVFGLLTMIALGLHFALDAFMGEEQPYTLLFAEWVGLIFIAIFFVWDAYLIARDADYS